MGASREGGCGSWNGQRLLKGVAVRNVPINKISFKSVTFAQALIMW